MSDPTAPPPRIRHQDLDHRDASWYVDRGMEWLLFLGGLSAILFIIAIFLFITYEGLGFITGRFDPSEFFTTQYWTPSDEQDPEFGILAMLAGTASVTGLAMLTAIPFSLGAAIYIAEFANEQLREGLKVIIELLAAIPSVVWGFIGLSVMNSLLIALFDIPVGLNIVNAGILLGLMATPVITSIAEDALKAVPDRHREAAEAMGATRWQVTLKVVLPAARNGLLGAVLLGVGRAFGETMVVLMATGHALNIPDSPFDAVRALTATIAAELGETSSGSDHYGALFTIGILLFLVTFLINLSADLLVRGGRRG